MAYMHAHMILRAWIPPTQSLTKNYTRALTVFQRYYRTYSLGFGAGNPELLPTLQQVIDMLPETPSPAYR